MWLKHAKFVVKHVKLAPKTVLIDAAKRCSLDIRTEDSEDDLDVSQVDDVSFQHEAKTLTEIKNESSFSYIKQGGK